LKASRGRAATTAIFPAKSSDRRRPPGFSVAKSCCGGDEDDRRLEGSSQADHPGRIEAARHELRGFGGPHGGDRPQGQRSNHCQQDRHRRLLSDLLPPVHAGDRCEHPTSQRLLESFPYVG